MVVIYKAFDGETFSSERACIEYERKELAKEKKLFEGLFMWGHYGNPITDLKQIETAWFVFIKDQKTLNLLNETITLYSTFPCEVGSWVYDERQDCFVPLNEVVSEMEKKLKMYKDFEYQATVTTKTPF